MKTFASILTSISTFLIPLTGFIYIIGGFVAFDTLYALYVAYKKKEPLTSDAFFNIAPKLFFYIGSIILGFMIDKYIMTTNVFNIEYLGAKVITVVFICNEIKSIDETHFKDKKVHISEIIRKYIKTLKDLKKDLTELTTN